METVGTYIDSPPEDDILEFRSEKRNLFYTDETPDDNELKKYLIHLNNVNLGYYVKDRLYRWFIARSIIKKIVCSYCIKLLIENRLDNEYSNNLTFTRSVNRGKLIITSKAVSLIIQQLKKSFQIIVI